MSYRPICTAIFRIRAFSHLKKKKEIGSTSTTIKIKTEINYQAHIPDIKMLMGLSQKGRIN